MKRKNGINNFSILIADDHQIIHRGLKELILGLWPGVEMICLSTLKQLLVEQKRPPRLIIIDVNLPGAGSQKIVSKIKAVHAGANILVFSSLNEDIYAVPLLKSGASGFLSKAAAESEIITAITSILAGGRYVSQQVKRSVVNTMFDKDNPFVALSSRELEIAGFLKDGYGILEIAKQLNLRMGTISTYKLRIFQKLRIRTVIELAEKMSSSDKTH